jgi:1-pyrroline-5-carboxylate dehydrogenase
MALAAGPSAGALAGGNTVIFKPASAGAMTGVLLAEALTDAGIPAGVFNLVMGPGATVGEELQANPGIDGIVFTGSFDVGFELFRRFSTRFPRPCIVEMGGKNPAIVTARADLDEAAEGIVRSAFGFGGQKCSANSRVYVERSARDELVRLLVQKTEKLRIGDPLLRENWLGPVIDAHAVERYERAAAEARRDGRIHIGGEHLNEGALRYGFYVEPTVVEVPPTHRLFRDELFVPLTAVAAVDSLGEAIGLANESAFGLTAGVYSQDPAEIAQFLEGIEAGVLYVNRQAGATTGAWPGVQAFGGWKGSGSTGKAGLSMYYPVQFMREQSHTVVD